MLELDFEAAKFLFFPRRDIYIYIYIYIYIFFFFRYSFYILLFVFTYLFFTPLDLENLEHDEHVPLQPVNGGLSIVGGYILLPEQEFIVLKRLMGNQRYSVAINQFVIIKTLQFLNYSVQFKILNYSYIYIIQILIQDELRKIKYNKINIKKSPQQMHCHVQNLLRMWTKTFQISFNHAFPF